MLRLIRIISIIIVGFSVLSAMASEPKIRVLTGGATVGIKSVPLEEYVKGVVTGELPKGWPVETLKAQAVAARTYAYYSLKERTPLPTLSPPSFAEASADRQGRGEQNDDTIGYDVRATVEDQVYKKGYVSSDVAEAVEATSGEIISYHDKPIKARFHSTCGGKTETSIHVWGEEDVSKGRDDPYCKDSPHKAWTISIGGYEIAGRLAKNGFNPGVITSIEPAEFEDGGRAAAVAIHGTKQTISLTGNDFRRYMGFDKIKSTKFSVSKNGDKFVFSGNGFGHGVGMCQWGAKGMAERGFSYREILEFYYPGTDIKKMYKIEDGTR